MIKALLMILLSFGVACNKKANPNTENEKTVEQTTTNGNQNQQSSQEKLEEFVYRTNEGAAKLWLKWNNNTFKPEVLKFQDKGSSDVVDLKVVEEKPNESRIVVENTKTKERFELSDEFIMVVIMFKNNKSFVFNREWILHSNDGKVLTTAGALGFVPFFYAEKEKDIPKEIKIPDNINPDQHHPEFPNDPYFTGILPNGKKVEIIPHTTDVGSKLLKITLILDEKKILFIEK